MTIGRVRMLMRRAGVKVGPLAHARTVSEYRAAIGELSDSELLEEYEDALREWARTLGDEELLEELRAARQECDPD